MKRPPHALLRVRPERRGYSMPPAPCRLPKLYCNGAGAFGSLPFREGIGPCAWGGPEHKAAFNAMQAAHLDACSRQMPAILT